MLNFLIVLRFKGDIDKPETIQILAASFGSAVRGIYGFHQYKITISLWACFHQYKKTVTYWNHCSQNGRNLSFCIIKRKFINGIKESNAPKHLELHYQVEVHTQIWKCKRHNRKSITYKTFTSQSLEMGLLVPIIKINAVLFNFWRKLPNPNVNDFNLSNPTDYKPFWISLHA